MSAKETQKVANKKTRELFLDVGGHFGTVERRLSNYVKKDLFGCVDFIGLHPQKGIVAVQVTAGGNGPARVKKVRSEFSWPKMEMWLDLGGRIEVYDWRKNEKSNRWEGRVAVIIDRDSKVVWQSVEHEK